MLMLLRMLMIAISTSNSIKVNDRGKNGCSLPAPRRGTQFVEGFFLN